jgi:hypothetical protein
MLWDYLKTLIMLRLTLQSPCMCAGCKLLFSRHTNAWPRRWRGSFDNFQTRPEAIDPAYPVLRLP